MSLIFPEKLWVSLDVGEIALNHRLHSPDWAFCFNTIYPKHFPLLKPLIQPNNPSNYIHHDSASMCCVKTNRFKLLRFEFAEFPSSRIAAKAYFVAWICFTFVNISVTWALSPPEVEPPHVTTYKRSFLWEKTWRVEEKVGGHPGSF